MDIKALLDHQNDLYRNAPSELNLNDYNHLRNLSEEEFKEIFNANARNVFAEDTEGGINEH